MASFLVILVMPFPILPAMGTSGVGWLEGWSHRKSHVINSAPGAGVNYQLKIIVHYGYGTDSGADVYCDNHCRPDFGDIRFTDNDGVSLLDYWIEEKTDSSNATFWVEIADDLSSSDATIYTYYGNPAASAASDGDATFILFDSYDDNSLDASKWNWQLDNNNASSVHLAEQNQRMESWKDSGSGVSGANYRESDDSWALERVVEFKLYVDYCRTSEGGYAHQWCVFYQDSDNWVGCTHNSYNSTHFWIIMGKVEGGSHTAGDIGYFSWDTWYYVRTRINSSSIVLEVFSGGFDETLEHVACLSHTRTGSGRVHNRIASTSSGTFGFKFFDDDFRVRKYTYPEPTHGIWEGEQYSWLTGWGYRKSHIIHNISDAGTNYQVRIVVHYGLGTDTGENAYCNFQCRTDFGDIRFTDDGGITELDYWMEEKVDSDRAVFWVEVADNLSSNDASIYLYYGNSDAITSSSGVSTFEFYIDKDNTTGWTLNNTDVTTSGDYLRFNNSVASNLGTAEKALDISSHYYVVEYRGKNIDVPGIADQISIFTYDSSWNHRPHQTAHPYFNDQQDFMYVESSFEYILWDEAFQFDTEYVLAAYVDETNSVSGVDYFVYDSARVERASEHDAAFAVGSPTEIDNIFIGDGTYSAGCDFRLRWLFIRKWTGNIEPAHGRWGNEEFNWLAGWRYRKGHIINPAAGAGTNYQIKIVVHYGYGVDNGAEVYCGTRCKADFGDIRFTDDDGITLLDYWMEEKSNYDKAIFWVEIADNLSSDSALIQLYYGNTDVNTTSNGSATFLWFDGFDGSILDSENWEEYGVPITSVSDGTCTITGDNDTSDDGIIFKNDISDHDNIRVDTKVKRSDWNRRVCANDIWIGSTPYRASFSWQKGDDPDPYDILWNTYTGSWNYPAAVIVDDPSLDTYYIFSQWKSTNQFVPFVYDADYLQMGTADARTVLDDTMKLRLHVSMYGSGSSTIVIDWVRIRKYVYPEPSHGAWKGSPTDHDSPLINYIAYYPTQPTYLEDVTVVAEVLDQSSLSSVLLYVNNGSIWVPISMTHVGGTVFNVTIPAQPAHTQVSFLIEAKDTVGNTANSSTYTYYVSDIPINWTNYTLDARSTLNVMLDIRSNQSIQVNIESVNLPGPPSLQFTVLYSPFSITANVSSGFTITIIYNYSDELLPLLGVDESTLAIYYWNGTDNTWYELPTNLDMSNNELTASADHLTIFAVLGRASDIDFGDGSYLPIMIAGIVLLALFVLSVLGLRFSRSRVPWGEHIIEPPARPTEEETVPEETAPEPVEPEESQPLPTSEPICTYCGHQNPVGARYCIRCGRSLG